jgi:hypothetical protein
VITLDADRVTALPVDQLGLAILADLVTTHEWNEYSYLPAAQRSYDGAALEAIAEAVQWLRARALIARTPGQTSDAAIFVTRTGRRVVANGPLAFYANERLQGGVHPQMEKAARSQFLIGEYELGVFAALKAVEVRQLGRASTCSSTALAERTLDRHRHPPRRRPFALQEFAIYRLEGRPDRRCLGRPRPGSLRGGVTRDLLIGGHRARTSPRRTSSTDSRCPQEGVVLRRLDAVVTTKPGGVWWGSRSGPGRGHSRDAVGRWDRRCIRSGQSATPWARHRRS